MGYSENKDKLIKLYECGDENNALHFSLFSYDNGPIKLQITRMFTKKDQTKGYGKAGRLNKDELKFLRHYVNDMIAIIEDQEEKG